MYTKAGAAPRPQPKCEVCCLRSSGLRQSRCSRLHVLLEPAPARTMQHFEYAVSKSQLWGVAPAALAPRSSSPSRPACPS
jgi:hypothetical protein